MRALKRRASSCAHARARSHAAECVDCKNCAKTKTRRSRLLTLGVLRVFAAAAVAAFAVAATRHGLGRLRDRICAALIAAALANLHIASSAASHRSPPFLNAIEVNWRELRSAIESQLATQLAVFSFDQRSQTNTKFYKNTSIVKFVSFDLHVKMKADNSRLLLATRADRRHRVFNTTSFLANNFRIPFRPLGFAFLTSPEFWRPALTTIAFYVSPLVVDSQPSRGCEATAVAVECARAAQSTVALTQRRLQPKNRVYKRASGRADERAHGRAGVDQAGKLSNARRRRRRRRRRSIMRRSVARYSLFFRAAAFSRARRSARAHSAIKSRAHKARRQSKCHAAARASIGGHQRGGVSKSAARSSPRTQRLVCTSNRLERVRSAHSARQNFGHRRALAATRRRSKSSQAARRSKFRSKTSAKFARGCWRDNFRRTCDATRWANDRSGDLVACHRICRRRTMKREILLFLSSSSLRLHSSDETSRSARCAHLFMRAASIASRSSCRAAVAQ